MPSLNELAGFHPCDRCGQRSREAWRHVPHDLLLTFCGHHSRSYGVAMVRAGFELFMVSKPIETNRLQGAL